MFTIEKQFTFDASHILLGMPEGHQCGRLHGHTYTVVIELKSKKLTEEGFVRDYGLLKPVKDYIDKNMDHRHLNDVLLFNPTAENIAKHIFDVFKLTFPEMSAVTVKETPKTAARYEPSPAH
jgi:6-pyruvoyltetrahydropterin/6-carboxytetrahydropterin synthase